MRLPFVFVVLLTAAGAQAQVPVGAPCPCPADPVLRWNELALIAVKATRTPPPLAARNLAILHIAVHDAVAAADGSFPPFHTPCSGGCADPRAAAAVAAHRILLDLYPRRVEDLDAALDDTLDDVPEGPAKARGIALGQAVAEDILWWRAGDAATARSDYAPRPGLGRWELTPPAFAPPLLPGWGKVACFALPDPARVRPPGPPLLTSLEYTDAYREVKALGAADSRVRTPDQTEVARFWSDGEGTVTPPGHWNRIAQGVSSARRLTLAENARLFAVLNVAMADAAVVCWECKYRFEFWRPVTAIRAGGMDADPAWSPLLPTPPFPAYTSGHSSFSGSAAAALVAFFGTDVVRFSTTSDGLPGVTRSFASFAAAAEEAGVSRVYGGIHWAFDNTDGLRCGREVGQSVAARLLGPARPARSRDVPVGFADRRRGRE